MLGDLMEGPDNTAGGPDEAPDNTAGRPEEASDNMADGINKHCHRGQGTLLSSGLKWSLPVQ